MSNLEAHPDSPRALCDRLGLRIDLSKYNSPAIVGSTGKRHYYGHGNSDGRREATCVLLRLIRLRNQCAEWNRPAYAEELTAIGPQLVIPGCERRPVNNGKPAQLSLFG